MPERPEVKLISEQLHQKLQNQEILVLEIFGGRYFHQPVKGFSLYQNSSKPIIIQSVQCHGKFIYFTLIDSNKNKFYFCNTLGMTGGWKIGQDLPKHSVAKIITHDQALFFTDTRRFGTLSFATETELQDKLSSLGPDLLNIALNKADFLSEFKNILRKHKNKNITQVLMNQNILSGIGNYVKAESLYFSGISPWRQCSLSNHEMENLLESILSVLKASYQNGGVSIQDFYHLDGTKGKFQKFLQVYGRICDPKGNSIISEKTPDGRTTWWCPQIQQ